MEVQERELLVRRLVEENDDFRSKYLTHKEYDAKISRLEKKSFLSPEDTVERNKLKKLKLAIKDELEQVIARHL